MKKTKNPYATLSCNIIKAPKTPKNTPSSKTVNSNGDMRVKEGK